MAAEFFCFILPIFSLFSLPIDCVLANILRRFFMDAKLAILQACLKVWKSGGASSKGRGQKSGGGGAVRTGPKTNKQTKKQPNVGGRDKAFLSVTIQDYANSNSIPSFML